MQGSIKFNSTFRITEQFVVLQYQLSPSESSALSHVFSFYEQEINPRSITASAKAYYPPFLNLFTGAELALVPIANITLDPVRPNADVVFLEGYNLLTTFPGLSPAWQYLSKTLISVWYMAVCMALK